LSGSVVLLPGRRAVVFRCFVPLFGRLSFALRWGGADYEVQAARVDTRFEKNLTPTSLMS
jgi:hypothetical protein